MVRRTDQSCVIILVTPTGLQVQTLGDGVTRTLCSFACSRFWVYSFWYVLLFRQSTLVPAFQHQYFWISRITTCIEASVSYLTLEIANDARPILLRATTIENLQRDRKS